MKRLSFIMALMLVVVALNAQITKVAVKVSDLPKAITENVAKNHTGFTIKDATKVTENNVVSYDVKISKGTTSETLVYDKDGKFLRQMPQTTAAATNTGSKPGEKAPAKH
jgi:hypothetical protein